VKPTRTKAPYAKEGQQKLCFLAPPPVVMPFRARAFPGDSIAARHTTIAIQTLMIAQVRMNVQPLDARPVIVKAKHLSVSRSAVQTITIASWILITSAAERLRVYLRTTVIVATRTPASRSFLVLVLIRVPPVRREQQIVVRNIPIVSAGTQIRMISIVATPTQALTPLSVRVPFLVIPKTISFVHRQPHSHVRVQVRHFTAPTSFAVLAPSVAHQTLRSAAMWQHNTSAVQVQATAVKRGVLVITHARGQAANSLVLRITVSLGVLQRLVITATHK
jgi:hypothetical protein